MKSNLAALLPPIYRGIAETGALAEIGDKQFGDWYQALETARLEQFALTAGPLGIAALERIYVSPARPMAGLEERRRRLLGRMRMAAPYTMRFLRRRLDALFGEGRHEEWTDGAAFALHVGGVALERVWFEELMALLRRVKPANLTVAYHPREEAQGALRAGHAVFTRVRCRIARQGELPPDARLDLRVAGVVRVIERTGV